MFKNWSTTKLKFINSKNGTIEFDDPGTRYKNPNERRNNNGPVGQKYCKFKTVKAMPDAPGVYALFVDDEVKPSYVGTAIDLSKLHFFSICPKDVFYNGQSTNCKLNHFILEKKLSGSEIVIKYFITDDFDSLKKELVEKYNPLLNER